MPALITYPDKTCTYCGKHFNRSTMPSGRLEDGKDYVLRRFCGQKCYQTWHVGPNHSSYNPNGSARYDGYIRIATGTKRVYLHGLIMEKHLGRKLKTKEHVHHKDGNPENNALENLELMTSSQHLKQHYHQRIINSKGQFT